VFRAQVVERRVEPAKLPLVRYAPASAEAGACHRDGKDGRPNGRRSNPSSRQAEIRNDHSTAQVTSIYRGLSYGLRGSEAV